METHQSLVQLLIPVTGGNAQAILEPIETFLSERFGGVTLYCQAPAKGIWKVDDDSTVDDRIVVVEVMTDQLDVDWWASYRAKLEAELAQDELLVRVLPARRL